MSPLAQGDRVVHRDHGAGTVVRHHADPDLVEVEYDRGDRLWTWSAELEALP